MNEQIEKLCKKCGKNKKFSDFYRSNKQPGGFTAWCKECSAEAGGRDKPRSGNERAAAFRDKRKEEAEELLNELLECESSDDWGIFSTKVEVFLRKITGRKVEA